MIVLVKGKRFIRLYPAIRCYSEVGALLTTQASRARGKSFTFADNQGRDQAMADRRRELEAAGWVTQGAPVRAAPRQRRGGSALDDRFGELARRTIAELGQADGAAEDERVWTRAVVAYRRLRKRAGGDPTEQMVHFFAVDGVGLETAHPVVVTTATRSAPRRRRWIALLETLAQQPA